MKKRSRKNNLSERHIAQIIRRNMIQKVKPSKEVYSRRDKQESSE